jgi:Fic family protein
LSHDSLRLVNAMSRGLANSDYRNLEAGIIDTENEFIHFFPIPESLGSLLDQYFKKFQNPKTIEDIVKAHCELIGIHPFSNGNGRTARFIADINLAALGFTPFLNTNINRGFYYSAMKKYLKQGEFIDMDTFIRSHIFINNPLDDLQGSIMPSNRII